MPKVTVLTATYNRPGALGDAIASVVDQTFSDWQMLVINDGGEDVRGIVETFRDGRITYFNRNKNRGKAACLNFGLQQAAGEYIAYLDDDDLWYPNHLELLARGLDENPDIGAVYSDLYAVQFIKDEANAKRYPLHKMIQVSRDYNRDFMFHYNHTLHVSLMHRRDLALRAGGYDETVTVLIDWNITRKLSFYTDFKYIPTLTGEYYMPIGKSDRISNLEREDEGKYRHNLRKIKADLPPEPWPKVDKVAVIFPVTEWTDSAKELITQLVDSICYPVRYLLINASSEKNGAVCRDKLGAIGDLKNVQILTPEKDLNALEAYRYGAERVDADYVYLPTNHAAAHLELRIITAMDYLRKTRCEGAKWDIEQEKGGPFDSIISREAFLRASDPRTGQMEALVGLIPRSIPESLACDFFANMADRQHRDGNYELAYQCARIAGSAKQGGVGDQFLVDIYSRICFALEKYDEAEEKCRTLIERGYGADNWIRLGRILQIRGRSQDAFAAFRKGLDEIRLTLEDLNSPVFPIFIGNNFGAFLALLGMGECLLETQDLAGAAKMFRRAAKLKANSPLPFIGFAKLFLNTDQLQKAREALLSAKARVKKNPEVYRLFGELYEKQEQLRESFGSYCEALMLDEKNPEHIESVHRIGAALGKWEELRRILEDFLEHRPAHLPTIKKLAEVYHRLGDRPGAESMIERGLLFDKKDSQLRKLYAQVLQTSKEAV